MTQIEARLFRDGHDFAVWQARYLRPGAGLKDKIGRRFCRRTGKFLRFGLDRPSLALRPVKAQALRGNSENLPFCPGETPGLEALVTDGEHAF
jgi:hypothetical protein